VTAARLLNEHGPIERFPPQVLGDPAPEPADALCGTAMREALRHHLALRLPLQPVVADGRGCVEPLLDVAILENLTRAVAVVRPHAGVTVRLQFLHH
jgi:hypothetical protein